MQIIPVLFCIVALVAGLIGAVLAPKAWQRAIALLVVSIMVFLVAQGAIAIGQKELMVWHYGRNIRASDRLWSIVQKDIEAGDYDKAKAELAIITTNWLRIGSGANSYSAADILKAVEEKQAANQASQTTPLRSESER